MNLFKRKTSKEQMLASVAAARLIMARKPASRFVIEMDDILKRFENAYADGREPEGDEVKGYLGDMVTVLEKLS